MKTLPLILFLFLFLLGGAIAAAEPLSIKTGLFEFTWGMNVTEATKVAEQEYPEAETVGPRDLSTGTFGQEIVIRKGKTMTTLRFFDGQLVEFARRVYDHLSHLQAQRRLLAMGLRDKFITPLTRP